MPVSDRDDALRELGRLVAERREEARLMLEDVYERTRIRVEFLRGIEEGDYTGFPDLVYIKGFVRTYLRVIGAEDLQDPFMGWLNHSMPCVPSEPVNVLGNGTSPTRGFRPVSHFWLFLVLLTALVGTGVYVWHVWPSGGLSLNGLRGLGQGGEPLLSAASEDLRRDEDSSGDVAPLEVIPASMEILVSLEPEPKPKPEPTPPPPSLEIRAAADVWMKVTIGDKVLFSKTLKKGSIVSWDLPAQAKVTYGRPNAALVVLNGKELGLANPKGSKRSETYLYSPDGAYRKAN